jgi:hypothetical protein
VYAELLKVSGVWACMVDKEEDVLKSDGNVVNAVVLPQLSIKDPSARHGRRRKTLRTLADSRARVFTFQTFTTLTLF